jgi:hypothetical protein
MVYSELGIGCSSQSTGCTDSSGCPSDRSADFCIKRNDTTPPFKVSLEDCDGVVDLTGNFVLEVSIWINSKLKRAITDTDTEISLADNIGFDQILENNVIVMNRARNSEKMLITGFDEENKTITVTRGYDGTTASSWSKGSSLKIFRAIDAEGEIESVIEDIAQEDGSVLSDQLTSTFLIFNWNDELTSLSGCFWLEFKLTEMNEDLSEIISVRRYPSEGEYLIRVTDSST